MSQRWEFRCYPRLAIVWWRWWCDVVSFILLGTEWLNKQNPWLFLSFRECYKSTRRTKQLVSRFNSANRGTRHQRQPLAFCLSRENVKRAISEGHLGQAVYPTCFPRSPTISAGWLIGKNHARQSVAFQRGLVNNELRRSNDSGLITLGSQPHTL